MREQALLYLWFEIMILWHGSSGLAAAGCQEGRSDTDRGQTVLQCLSKPSKSKRQYCNAMAERGEERASKKYQLIPTRTSKYQTKPKDTKEYQESKHLKAHSAPRVGNGL